MSNEIQTPTDLAKRYAEIIDEQKANILSLQIDLDNARATLICGHNASLSFKPPGSNHSCCELCWTKERLSAFKAFCPECGSSDLIPMVEGTEPGHKYCGHCQQEIFESLDYCGPIAAHLKERYASDEAAKE